MTIDGTVREWHSDQGWGVLESDETPGGCWAHFGSVLASGYRALDPGQAVSFKFERVRQDGFDFRAVVVWPVAAWAGDERPEPETVQNRSVAYRSTLHITFDEPGDGADAHVF